MKIRNLVALGSFLFLMAGAPVAFAYHDDGDEGLECRSENYSYSRCDVPWRDARLVQQLSSTACVRGRTWGIDRRGLWVDAGCGGVFVEAGRHGGGYHHDRDGDRDEGWRPEPGWDHRFSVTCESRDYRYRFCAADVGGGGRIWVENQISETPCVEGRTWGWNRAGVWVDGGCAATFVFDRRWR